MRIIAIIFLVVSNLNAFAQQEGEKVRLLSPFNRIVASPKIKLVLQKGEEESIRITSRNIEASQLNIVVKGKKLLLYLDDARYIERRDKWQDGSKRWKRSMYHNASVTAYVTYRELKGIEMRGEESLVCRDTLKTEKFKLVAYGATEMKFDYIETTKFKAVLYGENSLRVTNGLTGHQKYTLYGENLVETSGVNSETAATTIYGEGRLAMHVTDEVRVNAFGEPLVSVSGPAHLSKGLVFGRVGIRKE